MRLAGTVAPPYEKLAPVPSVGSVTVPTGGRLAWYYLHEIQNPQSALRNPKSTLPHNPAKVTEQLIELCVVWFDSLCRLNNGGFVPAFEGLFKII